jgi:AraC-like DNA-binding protein
MARPRALPFATVAGPVVVRVWDAARSVGLSEAACEATVGRPRSALLRSDAAIPVAAVDALFAAGARATPKGAFALRVAKQTALEDYPVLGLAMMSALDLRGALERLARYGGRISDAGRWEISEESESSALVVRWLRPSTDLGARVSTECALAQLLVGVRASLGPVTPLRVHFGHRLPDAPAAEALSTFFSATSGTTWGIGGAHSIEFTNELSHKVAPTASPAISRYFDETLAAAGATHPWTARTRAAIEQALASSGSAEAPTIAQQIAVSPRTLHRRLAEEGASFRALLDATRQALARRHLAASVPLAEIAYLVGFSEPSAFSRAFRRWFGHAPREHATHIGRPK